MLAPKNKKELQAFLGVINYLNKFSLGQSETCKLLRKLMSSKATWPWNASYQQLFDKAKSLIKVKMCMKFYDDTKPLYLETNASGISLGAALLQLRNNTNCPKDTAPDNTILHPIAFASKTLTGAECCVTQNSFVRIIGILVLTLYISSTHLHLYQRW